MLFGCYWTQVAPAFVAISSSSGLKYRTSSARDKTLYLKPSATEPGYEHSQTKRLARTVAARSRLAETLVNRGSR
jgi:hypothetical protein